MLSFLLNKLMRLFSQDDILSIDIGFTNIKIVHSRKGKGDVLKVLNFAITDTPRGCIKNGVISDMDTIAADLKKIISMYGISEKNVKIIISAGSSIVSKIVFIEKVEGKSVEEGIREEISRQMPVNMHDYKLFYRITSDAETEGRVNNKVLVTIVPNTIIENYARLLTRLNFKLLSVEIPFSSVARLFGKCLKTFDSRDKTRQGDYMLHGAAVIDLGSETTNISILKNGALDFNRIILNGGYNLDGIIAERLGVTRNEAENYKKLYGIIHAGPPEDETGSVIDKCIREYMGEILGNVKRSIEFYVDRCGGSPIENIFFIGGGSALKGLKQFSEEITAIPSHIIELKDLSGVEFAEKLDRERLRFLVNAIGTAM